MGRLKTTCWAGLAVSSLAIGGVFGCATGENLRPPTGDGDDFRARRRGPAGPARPARTAAAPAPLPQEAIPAGPAAQSSPSRPSDGCDPFAGQSELSAQSLATEVELLQPVLGGRLVGVACGRGAISAGDLAGRPDVRLPLSPGGVGREDNGGWMVEASQKIPWCGKRALRGTPPRRRRTPRRPTSATPD